MQIQYIVIIIISPPADSYMSYDDCLEDKREDYQNCSVQYCVPQLYSVICSSYRLVVIWPVKIVPDMTYNVFGGTLNPTVHSGLHN